MRWFRTLIQTVKVGRLIPDLGRTAQNQAALSQSHLEIPVLIGVRHHRHDDGSLTVNLDLNLTSEACAKDDMNAEGKNAREGLGLGSTLVVVWEKAQKAFHAIPTWPRPEDESRMARICGWVYKGGKRVELYHGDRVCRGYARRP